MGSSIGILLVMSLVSLIIFGIRKALIWKNGETDEGIRELREQDTERWENIEEPMEQK